MANTLDALFGYGRYRCLGRGIAFMELNKALPEVRDVAGPRWRVGLTTMCSQILRRYDFTVIDPVHPVKKMQSAAFWMMEGFFVTVTPRTAGQVSA